MLSNNSIIQEWDDLNKKEVEEAKRLYIQARKEHRTITDIEGKIITSFKPSLKGIIIKEKELNDTQVAMRVIDETGDRRIIWDSVDPDEVEEAAKLFKEYIDKGWRAYAVDTKGEKRRRVYGFDPKKEELLIDEQGTKEKLANFVKQFKQVNVLPRTYPG